MTNGLAVSHRAWPRIALATFTLTATPIALAQNGWTSRQLNGASIVGEEIVGTSGSQHVGNDAPYGGPKALLWNSNDPNPVSLTPTGVYNTIAYGVANGVQVGVASLNGRGEAVLWRGSADSMVNLHPTGATESSVVATNGVQHGGWIKRSWYREATLWSGSAGAYVSLHPTGLQNHSVLSAVVGNRQLGSAQIDGRNRAFLWNGSADNYVDLNPATAVGSIGVGMSETQQVGYAYFHSQKRAALWRGTAASWVDLNPLESTESAAVATAGDFQVGYIRSIFHAGQRASIWNGTAGSWQDLHLSLQGNYTQSAATGIAIHGGQIVVSGWAFEAHSGKSRAILWTRPVPEPGGLLAFLIGGLALARRPRR